MTVVVARGGACTVECAIRPSGATPAKDFLEIDLEQIREKGKNNPEATAAAIDAARWMHTGDFAVMREDGYLNIVGRLKDMIIRGGENVYCSEVEAALFEHPAVMDAAVIGIPHQVLGEEVGAVVQLKPDAIATATELQAHVGDRLAGFKVPVRIWFRDDHLPRNPAGKVLKRDLRDELLATTE